MITPHLGDAALPTGQLNTHLVDAARGFSTFLPGAIELVGRRSNDHRPIFVLAPSTDWRAQLRVLVHRSSPSGLTRGLFKRADWGTNPRVKPEGGEL